MRALAAFVMRGPLQATGVAVIAAALPVMFWISAAVIGLVILRVGPSSGLNVGLWALLPAMAWAWLGQDPTAFAVLVEVAAMALVLRQQASWQAALLPGVVLALVAGWLVPQVLPGLVDELTRAGTDFYRQLNPDIARNLGEDLDSLVRTMMIASMAASQLAIATGSLMLARSWQAKLYNPGGFQAEFHRFRLQPAMALGLVALMIVSLSLGSSAALVVMVAGLPLMLAGIALVHGLVGRKEGGGAWLLLFYVALFLLGPSLLVLIVLAAIVDSWVDFRGRLSSH